MQKVELFIEHRDTCTLHIAQAWELKNFFLNIDVLLYVGSREGKYEFCCKIYIVYFLLYWSTISYYDSAFAHDNGNQIRLRITYGDLNYELIQLIRWRLSMSEISLRVDSLKEESHTAQIHKCEIFTRFPLCWVNEEWDSTVRSQHKMIFHASDFLLGVRFWHKQKIAFRENVKKHL